MKRPGREANSLSHSSFPFLEPCHMNISTCRSALAAARCRSAAHFTMIRWHLQSGVSRCETADSRYSRFVWLELLLQHVVVIRAFGSSGMLCCVIVLLVYLQCNATSKLPGRLDTDDEGNAMFRNSRDHLPKSLFSGSDSCRKLLDT